MENKLKINTPAVSTWFNDHYTHVKIIVEGNTTYLKPTNDANDKNAFILTNADRGRKLIVFDGANAAAAANLFRNPWGNKNFLLENKGEKGILLIPFKPDIKNKTPDRSKPGCTFWPGQAYEAETEGVINIAEMFNEIQKSFTILEKQKTNKISNLDEYQIARENVNNFYDLVSKIFPIEEMQKTYSAMGKILSYKNQGFVPEFYDQTEATNSSYGSYTIVEDGNELLEKYSPSTHAQNQVDIFETAHPDSEPEEDDHFDENDPVETRTEKKPNKYVSIVRNRSSSSTSKFFRGKRQKGKQVA